MPFKIQVLSILSVILTSCSYGQLEVICQTEAHLKEISAVEYDAPRDVFWVIQDSGNSNELIAINSQGQVAHTLELKDTKNKDWEDLTIDKKGNIYIGDFGNNAHSRNTYKIYKISSNDLDKNKAEPQLIAFKLPKDAKEKDFEGFFLFHEYFYIFNKADHKTVVYKVPNKKGEHKAEKLYSHKFTEKASKITSAAISPDGNTVVLLNHYRLWKLSDFKSDDFFSGTIESMDFNHSSQKEGVGFVTNKEVVITDERTSFLGGNVYRFRLK